MSNRRFDWHEHIREVWGEYWAAREAVDHLRRAVLATPELLARDSLARRHLRGAHENLKGTYLVRLFAAFEAALRSYDRAVRNDPARMTDAATMIAQIGGRRGRGIQHEIRDAADSVRKVRNYWAHESDDEPGPMTIHEASTRLQKFLSELPETW